jgi:hypothetical protein
VAEICAGAKSPSSSAHGLAAMTSTTAKNSKEITMNLDKQSDLISVQSYLKIDKVMLKQWQWLCNSFYSGHFQPLNW